MTPAGSYTETDFKDTEIGLIPADWDVVPLQEVLLKTKTHDPRKHPDREFPYIDVSSVSNESNQVFGYNVIMGADAPSRARKVVQAGDTLFATVRPYLRNIAQVPDDFDQAICSTGFCVIRADPEMASSKYLFFAVMTDDFVNRVVALQRGSSYPAVTDEVVKSQLVPLPPLPEQRRIADALNAIQDEIAAQDDILNEARAFKRSLMERLFTYGPGEHPAETRETEIGEIPAHWEVVELGDVLELLQYGTSKRCDYDANGTAVLRIPNVIGGKINPTDLKFAEFTGNELDKLSLQDGDLLFVRTNGNREYSGRSAVYHDIPSPSLYASYLIRARFRPDTLLPDFAQAYTETPMGKSYLSGRATETADGKFNINTGTINSVLAPMPPIEEQAEIVSQFIDIDAKIAVEEDRKAALQDVFQSALHQLMTGQVRLVG